MTGREFLDENLFAFPHVDEEEGEQDPEDIYEEVLEECCDADAYEMLYF